jgi:hypothetical protein
MGVPKMGGYLRLIITAACSPELRSRKLIRRHESKAASRQVSTPPRQNWNNQRCTLSSPENELTKYSAHTSCQIMLAMSYVTCMPRTDAWKISCQTVGPPRIPKRFSVIDSTNHVPRRSAHALVGLTAEPNAVSVTLFSTTTDEPEHRRWSGERRRTQTFDSAIQHGVRTGQRLAHLR